MIIVYIILYSFAKCYVPIHAFAVSCEIIRIKSVLSGQLREIIYCVPTLMEKGCIFTARIIFKTVSICKIDCMLPGLIVCSFFQISLTDTIFSQQAQIYGSIGFLCCIGKIFDLSYVVFCQFIMFARCQKVIELFCIFRMFFFKFADQFIHFTIGSVVTSLKKDVVQYRSCNCSVSGHFVLGIIVVSRDSIE